MKLLLLLAATALSASATQFIDMSGSAAADAVPDEPVVSEVLTDTGTYLANFTETFDSKTAIGEALRELRSTAAPVFADETIVLECGGLGLYRQTDFSYGDGYSTSKSAAEQQAWAHLVAKLFVFGNVKCGVCPNGDQCFPFIDFYEKVVYVGHWEQNEFGKYYRCTANYSGDYYMYCTDC